MSIPLYQSGGGGGLPNPLTTLDVNNSSTGTKQGTLQVRGAGSGSVGGSPTLFDIEGEDETPWYITLRDKTRLALSFWAAAPLSEGSWDFSLFDSSGTSICDIIFGVGGSIELGNNDSGHGAILDLYGSTSGKARIVPPAVAGSPTLTLPTANGTFALTSQLAQTLANVSNKWLNSYDSSTCLFTQTQPAFSNLSGSAVLTSQVSGVLPPANGGVANISTAGQGYWHAIPPLGAGLTFNTNSVIAATANRVYMCQVVLEHRQKISQVTFVTGSTAGITAGNNFGWGIYSADGTTKLTSINVAGAVATSTGVVTTITPITLDPGAYWIAWVCTLNTTTMSAFAEAGNAIMMGSAAGQVKRWGDAGASNSTSAGSLPSSLVLPSTASGQTMPVLFCEP